MKASKKRILLLRQRSILLTAALACLERRKKLAIHPLRRKRLTFGQYHHYMSQIRQYPDQFRNWLRMSPACFDELLNILRSELTKKAHNAISAEERLVVTLRFLASGASFKSLMHSFRLGHSTIHYIVTDTCAKLWHSLKHLITLPKTEDEWRQLSDDFARKWQYPHCIGSIDGKHIRIKTPPRSGSNYYNYKGYCSTILLAVCDANLRLIYVDIGSYGKQGDAGVFRDSALAKLLEGNDAQIPEADALPGTDVKFPYVIVGDAAFPLSTRLMRPYPVADLNNAHRVYNYRHSRARRTIENVFGVLSQRWRVLLGAIEAKPDNADLVVKAVCVLHNFLKAKDSEYLKETDPRDVKASGSTNSVRFGDYKSKAKSVAFQYREEISQYFCSEVGSVPWQMQMVNKTSN